MAYLDDDDLWLPRHLEMLEHAAQRLGRPDDAVSVLHDHTAERARRTPRWVLRRYLALRTDRALAGRMKRLLGRGA